jgi:hypothetical protein
MPHPICSEPSFLKIEPQTFSVQLRSLWDTAAKVSAIWWLKPSSEGTSMESVRDIVTPESV